MTKWLRKYFEPYSARMTCGALLVFWLFQVFTSTEYAIGSKIVVSGTIAVMLMVGYAAGLEHTAKWRRRALLDQLELAFWEANFGKGCYVIAVDYRDDLIRALKSACNELEARGVPKEDVENWRLLATRHERSERTISRKGGSNA